MKNTLKYSLLILVLFFQNTRITAQTNLDCNVNIKKAIFYLHGDEKFKMDTLKSIEFLKPCVKLGDSNSQILLGRIYASMDDAKKNKKAFEIFEKLAKEGNSIACTDLGVLYKYGRGCDLNFNKARKWFLKGSLLGNDKANYALGYLYLKGFGNIKQDYPKAIKWFEKSNYPMAKYWLGLCYYYGYGVQKDIKRANELLGTSLLSSNTSNNSNATNYQDINTLENISTEKLSGRWTGDLLKFDWSGKHIEQKHPLSIEFKYDSINERLFYVLSIENQNLTGNLTKINNSIYFEDTEIKLPHASFNDEIPTELNYRLLSSHLEIKIADGIEYLTGSIENFIEVWNESGAPLRFILKKEETSINSSKELTDDALTAFSEQKESFIKLYPNPFENDLIISYTLDTTSYVEVQVSDINGIKSTIVEKGIEQEKGNHSYFFDGTNLEKGYYIISIIVNSIKKTRIIVKK